MVEINEELCIGCGKCVNDCISGILRLKNGVARARIACIACGHCVAVCPVNAVSIPEYDMEEVEKYSKGLFELDIDQFIRVIKFRRSIRNYQERKVEKEKLDKIVQAGRYTATAVNYQDCRFIVVQEQLEQLKDMIWEGIEGLFSIDDTEMSEFDKKYIEAYKGFYNRHKRNPKDDYLFRNAPVVLFVAADILVDAGLASQNMELAAIAQGLGMLYNGYLVRVVAMNEKVKEWLGVDSKQLVTCMLLGYPNISYQRTAPRRKGDIIWK